MNKHLSSRFERAYARDQALEFSAGLRSYLLKVYQYMGMGLALSGLIAWLVSSSPTLLYTFMGTPLRWLVMLAPLGLVFSLSGRIHTLSVSAAQSLFWFYAALMGVSLSSVFLVYTGTSIARVFFITAGTFSAISLYGYTTRNDLSSLGSFLLMGLIGVIITGFVNLFLQSDPLVKELSFISVLVFVGLTAWDVKRLKSFYLEHEATQVIEKKALMGVLMLYMDFLNLFISLLHLLGHRREQ